MNQVVTSPTALDLQLALVRDAAVDRTMSGTLADAMVSVVRGFGLAETDLSIVEQIAYGNVIERLGLIAVAPPNQRAAFWLELAFHASKARDDLIAGREEEARREEMRSRDLPPLQPEPTPRPAQNVAQGQEYDYADKSADLANSATTTSELELGADLALGADADDGVVPRGLPEDG